LGGNCFKNNPWVGFWKVFWSITQGININNQNFWVVATMLSKMGNTPLVMHWVGYQISS
jgi:hypothetical protein